MRLHFLVVLICVLQPVLCGCAATPAPRAQLFEGLDLYPHAVTTRSAEAQRWFDQGFLLYQAFNLEEAGRSFARAAELDPACAMAWWGVALAAGPHINNPVMDEASSRAAHEAIGKAEALAPQASALERDLIGALAKRYAWPPPADRGELDRAYAAAMREVARAHPDDVDVATLFAVALMETRPWDHWSSAGEPRPETPEIVATLEAVLARKPLQPLANHALIHALEASPNPEKSLAAADRLRELVPAAAHLVHMPSHIDIRLGRYPEAIAANARAIEADRRYVALTGSRGFYNLYRSHNYHFLVYAAMFDGQSELALRHARELVEVLPAEALQALPDILESFLATPLHVLVRFGRWQEILAEPEPPAGRPVTTATWRYARGLAFAARGQVEEAAAERAAFERAFEAVPDSAAAGNNPARVVLEIGRAMLEGELAYRRGDFEAAFAALRDAVARDAALRYDEPWGWMQPAAHALGALLLEQRRLEEAEAVYRSDLERHPGNGWSLHGLAECLRRRGAAADAAAAEAKFREAWKRADIAIRASCFCRLEPH